MKIIFGFVILFHILVMISVIPYEYVWGGRLRSYDEMIMFETVGLVMVIVMILIVHLYQSQIIANRRHPYFKFLFWMMCGLFALNTLGNMAAKTELETIIFTPVTMILSLLSLRIALHKEQQ